MKNKSILWLVLIALTSIHATEPTSWLEYDAPEYSLKYPKSLNPQKEKDQVVLQPRDLTTLPGFHWIEITHPSGDNPWESEPKTACPQEMNVKLISGYKVEGHCWGEGAAGTIYSSFAYLLSRKGVNWQFDLATAYPNARASEMGKGERIRFDRDFKRREKDYLSLFNQLVSTFKFKK